MKWKILVWDPYSSRDSVQYAIAAYNATSREGWKPGLTAKVDRILEEYQMDVDVECVCNYYGDFINAFSRLMRNKRDGDIDKIAIAFDGNYLFAGPSNMADWSIQYGNETLNAMMPPLIDDHIPEYPNDSESRLAAIVESVCKRFTQVPGKQVS
jgi:hypothetical protein